jgi:dipeptidyl aminopeptidase/acylaminoacyl peptidase
VALVGDEKRYQFFDPQDQKVWSAISAAYPGSSVTLQSVSDDRRKFVVRVDSPTDGPAFSLVDLNTGKAKWIGDEYLGLKPADVAPARSISFKARDDLDLTGYLTLPQGRDQKKLPLVVLPHGGPAVRDEPGFDWWSQALASRGYAVLRVNYRGSTGFGWDFQSQGFGQWGRRMQTDLSDGVRYLASQGVIDSARVCIVGASYGGYAALAGAMLDPGVYRCAASVSGPADLRRMIDWENGRQGRQGIASERYWLRYMGAYESLGDISPAEHADKITIPILLIHGKDDTVVPFEQSEMMADALRKAGKPVEFVALKGEDHWLSRGDTRLQMLQAVTAFLEKNNPP